MMKVILSLAALASITSFAKTYMPCVQDPAKQKARSQELKEIFDEDQADRISSSSLKKGTQKRDRLRRQRVGKIFGEGCLTTAQDYLHAAIVYQHGDHTDHFFQTFIWSKRGVELGDLKQKRNMALGLDRYLVNTGRKQLFASQAFKKGDDCWCLEPVEKTVPETFRSEYMSATLADQFAWVDTLNKSTSCPAAKECEHELKDTPKGTVPGFW